MKYFSNKFMLNLLKIFLIIVLFFLLIRFFSKDVIEGARGRRRKRLKKLRKRWKKKRKKERRNEKTQKAIQNNIDGVLSNFKNIKNCAISYKDSLQLSENNALFKIFGNDKIIQCSEQMPKIVHAKKSKHPSGINLIPPSGLSNTSFIKYGDEVGLCGNSNYKITNKVDANSTEKVKYGDNIQITSVSNPESAPFNVTINPNVYGLSNVDKLTSNDFSNLYVTKYSVCKNSTNNNDIVAT